MKKIRLVTLWAALSLILVGCDKVSDEGGVLPGDSKKEIREIDPGKIVIERGVDLDDLPEGVVPIKVDSREEALEYFKKNLQEFLEILPNKKVDSSLLLKNTMPLLKTRAESSGVTLPPEEGSFYATYSGSARNIHVGFKWEKLLGEIEVTSWIDGWILGDSWEQKQGTGNWLYDGELDCWGISYTVVGVYTVAILIEGIGDIYSYTTEFSGLEYLEKPGLS